MRGVLGCSIFFATTLFNNALHTMKSGFSSFFLLTLAITSTLSLYTLRRTAQHGVAAYFPPRRAIGILTLSLFSFYAQKELIFIIWTRARRKRKMQGG
jgi:hypothetical protein